MSASPLKVGDVCEIVADKEGAFPEVIGCECVIVGPLELRDVWLRGNRAGPLMARYLVKMVDGGLMCARPEELRAPSAAQDWIGMCALTDVKEPA